jgi:hypothetical protein
MITTTVQGIAPASQYEHYGQKVIVYRLVIDTGDVVFLHRSEGIPAPREGDIITGTIEPDKDGNPKLTIASRKAAKLDPHIKADIRGTQLFIQWRQEHTISGISSQDFLTEFREFQALLSRN